MNIEITSRHFTPSEELKVLVNEKMAKLEKYNVSLTRCHVILSKENAAEEKVEIVAHSKGHEFVAHDNSSIFEKSLANSVNKLSIQLKKQHDKIIGH
ncbi:MAG: ribosome-associated translation inhibitor RaiA [Candidatus Marinimicrobia bacterium]|nr:ribosome-associated translation inhibitor RaiA [Candidatus Neomarinimicrobiota bacterium]